MASHLKAAMHVLRYLKCSRHYCIVYKWHPRIINVVRYSNADWGSDENNTISYTGYTVTVYGDPASWTWHNQTKVAKLNNGVGIHGSL